MSNCTLSAALCLASAVGQSEAPTKSSGSGYPKKVTTLKKRPTKTPSTAATSAIGTQSSTTKPSKPRVKIATTGKTRTTKAPALDARFSNLPADDLEFIKELDKQFKLHGNKIKIKVERDNSTNSSGNGKNNKRTIDGELGYGYAHPGYDYTPPKFMFYPYSQHDIPATESPDAYAYSPADYEQPETTQPHPHQQVTSVTIEPSYSYELKPQTSYESQQPAAEQHVHPEQPQIDLPQPQPQQQPQHETSGAGGDESAGYQEPVIVLRIPGPAKYAAHLQTLLQQYLEIRAAQYLHLLQEAEQRKQQQPEEISPQQYATPEQHEEAHYHPDVSYAHQLAPTPPPVQYGPIDDVYQTYKGRQPQQQIQYEQPAPEAYYNPSGYHQQQTQFYYAQPQQQAQYESSYQPHLYLIAMAPQAQYAEPSAAAEHQLQHHQLQHHQQQEQQQQQPIYVAEQEAPTAAEAQSAGHELPITENNPRATHTKVIFNSQSSGGDYGANTYDLSSIQPYEEEHQQQHHQQHHHHHHHQQQQQQHQQQVENVHVDVEAPADDYQPSQASAEAMGITQPPYNYHAHGLKMPRQVRQGKRAAKADHPAEHQLQQIREYVREKLGAEMGSAVEYKTTQLLEG
ncbi:putative uncharacterized protein DDB_G0271606 [Drosophila innubila]|uniref:putative uncharacterized protein DDB_G0271606 n=1 Tax=Drosophila innubila TaxID=198719 RepID=UPI00148BD328|nr:putative uncharacterized protein DDB_G0271606 [Drosophila innubila]